MIFSADWYPTDATEGWKLQGAEVILEAAVVPKIRELKNNTGIYLSMHAPMSVAIGSKKPGVRFMSTEIVCKHLQFMKELQPSVTNRIVVHAASYSSRQPDEVYEIERKTLWSLWYKMKERGLLDNSLICIENLGKINQVGTIEDICKLCRLTDNFIPCIDFGHLHARTLGKFLNSKEEFQQVFDELYSRLPAWKVNCMHIHFSKLEYTSAGEKKHVPFSVRQAGPKPGFFIRAIPESSDFNPVIVCESPDSYCDGYTLQQNFVARKASML